jgi:hypothetical protein
MLKRIGTCSVCGYDECEVVDIPIYVCGSEGLALCYRCEMDVVEHISSLRRLVSRTKVVKFKADRKTVDQHE